MKDDDLKRLFEQADRAPVNAEAKKSAVNLAMAAFDETVQQAKTAEAEKSQPGGQGFWHWFRPTGANKPRTRRTRMNISQQKWLYSGVAGAFVSVLALSVYIYQPQMALIETDFSLPHVELRRQSPANERASVDESAPVDERAPADDQNTLAGGQSTLAGGQSTLAGGQSSPAGMQSIPERDQGTPAGIQSTPAEQEALTVPAAPPSTESPARLSADKPASTARADLDFAAEPQPLYKAKKEAFELADRASNEAGATGITSSSGAGKVASKIAAAPVQPRSMQENNRLMGQAMTQAPAVAADALVASPLTPVYQEKGRDRFEEIETNPVKRVVDEPVSTFSIDVDTASYSFVRRQLNQGVLPQKDAVRVEEMLNYFHYDYPLPADKSVPFEPTVLVSDSPWKPGNKLIQIGIKGYDLAAGEKPRTNLVFLLDVSGSMNSPDKLPLVKQSMSLLLSQLQPEDSIGIVVYAGAAGTVLEPTKVKDKQKIMDALNRLQAGGSTAGAQGIKLAYQLAESNFDKNAVNRIILATDGDFNVGITNRDELKGFVERQRDKGIFLSVLGFGQGNYHDHMMQVLAQNGNGVAAYIDTLSEAQKVLVDEATSTLFNIARDVKIQVEFNPATVSEYRLLGYETRHLNREDFNNDAVDAGDIGAGHTVTAIYEITPVGSGAGLIDDSRYAPAARETDIRASEYGFLKMRYKLPGATTSKLLTRVIPLGNAVAENSANSELLSREGNFATAVAGFAQLLRGGQYTGTWSYDDAIALAQANKGEDLFGYRTELVQLIRKAKVAAAM